MNKKKVYVGAHVSIAGGVQHAPARAAALGAGGFAVFLKNQRRWEAPPYSDEEVALFGQAMAEHGFSADRVLVHAGYLINPGVADAEKREKMQAGLCDEVQRLDRLGLTMLNLHPGSHLNLVSPEECRRLIAAACDRALEDASGRVRIVLETTAGQGTNLGSRFEELAAIIGESRYPERYGVCLDTCHSFQAGYDLASVEGWEETMAEFDREIGLERLCGFHLNDAQAPLGSHKDRHASLGEGTIGWGCFERIVADSRFHGMPLILETPDESLWAAEIARLQKCGADA